MERYLVLARHGTFNPDDLPSYARWCCGIDFGFDHPFAAVLIAWAHDTGQIWVIDSLERSSALYHVRRIHAMTRGLRVRKLLALSPAFSAGAAPLTRDELFAKAGVLGIMSAKGVGEGIEKFEKAYVLFLRARSRTI